MAFSLNLSGKLFILTPVCSALICGQNFRHNYCMLIFNRLGLKHGKFNFLSSDNFYEVLHKTQWGYFCIQCMPSERIFSIVTINKDNHFI